MMDDESGNDDKDGLTRVDEMNRDRTDQTDKMNLEVDFKSEVRHI